MNVVFSSSDLYAKCTGVAIYSLLLSNSSIKELNIYLLSTDVSPENINTINQMVKKYGRNFIVIQASELLKAAQRDLGLSDFKGGLNTYARAIANKVLPESIDKALFVDSDILFNGDLSELDKLDMSDSIVAGVPEAMLMTKYVCYENKDLLSNCENYINYGVVYFNMENWRRFNGDKLIRECVSQALYDFRIAEQSIMNLAFKDYTKLMPVKFNFYTMLHGISFKTMRRWYPKRELFSLNEFEEAVLSPIIIHFVGDYFNRPWYKGNICRYNSLYQKYFMSSPWKEDGLDDIPNDFSLIFKVYYNVLIFLRKYRFDNCYFLLRYIIIQFIREKFPFVEKIRRKL